jgi:hypothetical protein
MRFERIHKRHKIASDQRVFGSGPSNKKDGPRQWTEGIEVTPVVLSKYDVPFELPPVNGIEPLGPEAQLFIQITESGSQQPKS